MKAQRQPLSAGCWEVLLSVLGSLAHQPGVVSRAAHRPCLCRIQRIDGHSSRGRQCRWHSKRDRALAGGCSARASGFGSPRRPVTRSAVTYVQPVTRHWNLRSISSASQSGTLFIVGQIVGQPARTLADISDPAHAPTPHSPAFPSRGSALTRKRSLVQIQYRPRVTHLVMQGLRQHEGVHCLHAPPAAKAADLE
jgi:hypothetical protein